MKRSRKILERGWEEYRSKAVHPQARAAQVDAIRRAFYTGAHYLWHSIMANMDPEPGAPTESDQNVVEGIQLELDAFTDEIRERLGGPSRN